MARRATRLSPKALIRLRSKLADQGYGGVIGTLPKFGIPNGML